MKKIFCTVVALALAGCGSSPGSSPTGPTTDQACSDLAHAQCDKRSACTSGVGISRAWGDATTCLAREKLACTSRLSAPQSGSTPAQTEKCVAAYATFSCADFFADNAPPDCIALGPRASGAACAFAAQCQSGYCNGTRTSKCGTCGAPLAVGDACTTSSCARGDECVSSTLECEIPGSLGGSCGAGHPCGADLACQSGSCEATTATSGADCTVGQPRCDGTKGLFCGGGVGAKTCQAIALAGGGAPCGDLPDGSFAACTGGGECITAGGTVAQSGESGSCLAPAADGAACDIQSGPPCLAPARCVTSGGTKGTCALPDGSKCG